MVAVLEEMGRCWSVGGVVEVEVTQLSQRVISSGINFMNSASTKSIASEYSRVSTAPILNRHHAFTMIATLE